MYKSKYYFCCVNCQKLIYSNNITYLCPDCSTNNSPISPPKGVLKVLYNYAAINKKYANKNLFNLLKETKFIDLLPIKSTNSLSPLKVGKTPLYKFKASHISKAFTFDKIYFKDDALNPTYSLKDRASEIVSAWAKENNIDTIVAASTGNAGSSIAGICASQKQKAIVCVPEKAPLAKLLQIMHYGALIVPVKGNYDDAFELSIDISKEFGYYNRNTAFNPFTIEGKKTVAFEIFDNLNMNMPDFIFVSVGDGVIISGLYKGFEDLLMLGIINKMPTIVAVQSEKSKNLIANLKNKKNFIIYPSDTLADSISVDVPRNFYMTKDYLYKYKGKYLLVSDDEISNASKILSNNTGIFSEPAASAAFAGLLKYSENSKIAKNAKIVVLLTGSGLKDIKSIQSKYNMPAPIKPNIESFKKFVY